MQYPVKNLEAETQKAQLETDLKRARGMMKALVNSEDTDTSMYRLLQIAVLAIEYGKSNHTRDSNCNAGDCDDCTARQALKNLELVVGTP